MRYKDTLLLRNSKTGGLEVDDIANNDVGATQIM
jgi:hypothetical protein